MSFEHSLHLYNTLTQNKETFIPLQSPTVKLYVCGPTVYDDAHLGHARCYMAWDVLFRHLQLLGYDVTYARNITDVDDKILNRAEAEGINFHEISARYTQRFAEDMASLNILKPTLEPKATEHINTMESLIQGLIQNQSAYETPQGVYFRINAKKDYGKLSRKPLDDMMPGARVSVETDKESPLDFALWKRVSEDDTRGWSIHPDRNQNHCCWGRPGWHLECSAMNYALIGDQIDLHAGGADLMFPHHENEIAQTEAFTKKKFAQYWLHNGFVTVDGEKMSKSLGNFSTVRDLLSHYPANTLRYFLLTTHYRMPVDFNPDGLNGAHNRVLKLHRSLHQIASAAKIDLNSLAEAIPTTWKALESSTAFSTLQPSFEKYRSAMDDDLNTPIAVAVLDELFTHANRLKDSVVNENAPIEPLQQTLDGILFLWQQLGFMIPEAPQETTLSSALKSSLETLYTHLDLTPPSDTIELSQWLEPILACRQQAKVDKNWPTADHIRNTLQTMGIQIMDSKTGVQWELMTPTETANATTH